MKQSILIKKKKTYDIINMTYIFIDPFSKTNSGVTAYINISSNRLNLMGIKNVTISKNEKEDINQFRLRVAKEIGGFDCNNVIIEAPESLASTRLISRRYRIHIRLHCSRSLGALVQNLKVDNQAIYIEQQEINRAWCISSPSNVAYLASKSLFYFKNKVIFYPNPIPIYKIMRDKHSHDFAFIGRMQNLKGCDTYVEIARKNPSKSFAIVTSKQYFRTESQNIIFYDTNELNKYETYALAETIVIPSLFETASMVYLEAVAMNKKIIAWEHIGASEYFKDEKGILTLKIGEKLKISKIAKTLENINNPDYSKASEKLNLIFDGAIKGILEERTVENDLLPPSERTIKYINKITKQKRNIMSNISNASIYRKTKKLIKNPNLFFIDWKKKKNTQKTHQLKKSNITSNNDLSVQLRDASYIPDNTIENSINMPVTKKTVNSIRDNTKIEFIPLQKSPSGYNIAFFYDENTPHETIESIILGFNSFTDFKYISEERLTIGEFNVNPNTPVINIINKIDVKNKAKLALIDFIILLSAPTNLCIALRSCSPNTRIISIEHNEINSENMNISDAVIIADETHDTSQYKTPIINTLKDLSTLHYSVRKILQDCFPKNPDMLLALTPQANFFIKKDFLEFDNKNHDGILIIKNHSNEKFFSMREYYILLNKNFLSLALKESVYLRYRDLCEDAIEKSDYQLLIEKILSDGYLLDVKTL